MDRKFKMDSKRLQAEARREQDRRRKRQQQRLNRAAQRELARVRNSTGWELVGR